MPFRKNPKARNQGAARAAGQRPTALPRRALLQHHSREFLREMLDHKACRTSIAAPTRRSDTALCRVKQVNSRFVRRAVILADRAKCPLLPRNPPLFGRGHFCSERGKELVGQFLGCSGDQPATKLGDFSADIGAGVIA